MAGPFGARAEAHGGTAWAQAKTLVLEGHAVFWGPEGAAPRSTADDYRMWRVFDPAREAAHAAEGKVRIIANARGKPMWTVGYDGVTTWNEKGVIPADQAATSGRRTLALGSYAMPGSLASRPSASPTAASTATRSTRSA